MRLDTVASRMHVTSLQRALKEGVMMSKENYQLSKVLRRRKKHKKSVPGRMYIVAEINPYILIIVINVTKLNLLVKK